MLRLWHLFTFVFIILIALSFRYDDAFLMNRQKELQMQIGDKALTRMAYDFCVFNDKDAKILTSCNLLGYTPLFEDRTEIVNLSDNKEFFERIRQPDIKYLLIENSEVTPEIQSFVEYMISSGGLRNVAATHGWLLFETRRH